MTQAPSLKAISCVAAMKASKVKVIPMKKAAKKGSKKKGSLKKGRDIDPQFEAAHLKVVQASELVEDAKKLVARAAKLLDDALMAL